MKYWLARLGAWLTATFTVYKGVTYTVQLGRVFPQSYDDRIMKKRMLNAWYRNQELHLYKQDLEYVTRGLSNSAKKSIT